MNSIKDKLIVLLILVYIVLFEWGVFEADVLRPITNFLKLIIPLLLVGLVPIRHLVGRRLKLYFLFYLLFMFWALVPCLLSTNVTETMAQWYKYLWRFIFFFMAAIFYHKNRTAIVVTIKGLVWIGIFTFVQFIILFVTMSLGVVGPFPLSGIRGIYYGPLGILGNQIAMMFMPGVSLPILRLTGFWLEPSNSSGFMMATFFLSRALYALEIKRIWNICSIACLVGGLLAMSNAGYLALAFAMLVGSLLVRSFFSTRNVLMLTLVLGLGFTGFLGRYYVMKMDTESVLLRIITGAREKAVNPMDAYGGRVEKLNENLNIFTDRPLGVGFLIPGDDFFEAASGSAPVLMGAYTGVLGLLLLLLRESQVVATMARTKTIGGSDRCQTQAWAAVFMQHMVYGSWMSPLYLFLSLIVLLPKVDATHVSVPTKCKGASS